MDTTGNLSVGFSRNEVMRDQLSYCGHFLTIREDKEDKNEEDKDKEDEDEREKDGHDEVKKKEVSLIHQFAKDYLYAKPVIQTLNLKFFVSKKRL